MSNLEPTVAEHAFLTCPPLTITKSDIAAIQVKTRVGVLDWFLNQPASQGALSHDLSSCAPTHNVGFNL